MLDITQIHLTIELARDYFNVSVNIHLKELYGYFLIHTDDR